MYDSVNHAVPKYITDLFTKCSESNPYKSRLRDQELNIDLARVPKTEFYKGSFSYRGVKNWNSLPHNLKSSNSKQTFKKLLLGKQIVS